MTTTRYDNYILVPAVPEERRLRCRGVDRGGRGGGRATGGGSSYRQERTDDPVLTTAVPSSRDPTYKLLYWESNMMQSVLRMRRLRRELDREGQDTGEEKDGEGGRGRSMDLYGKLVHINKQ